MKYTKPYCFLSIAKNENTDLNKMHSNYFRAILCILDFVSFVSCCFLHSFLYRSMQRQDFRMLNKTNIIDVLLKCYSVIAPIAISCGVIYGNIALFDFYPENVNPWFCHMSHYICQLSFLYLAMFSLSVAIMRYICIVHYDKTVVFGLEKLKHTLLLLHILIPIMITAAHVVSTGNVDPMMTINKC